MNKTDINNIVWVSVFAIAFAFVEASVVVYLCALYYPGGFSFPLEAMPSPHVAVELSREFATLVMLIAVGIVSGRTRWTRFSYFMIAFGVWDIFYYVWLKALLNWPATLLDWDILFLIPVPWIGPVIAPCLISALMIVAGILIIRTDEISPFHPSILAWIVGLLGSLAMLYSFINDTNATIRFQLPQPYRYEFLVIGMVLSMLALARSLYTSHPRNEKFD
jgi:hypothetical protein